MPETPPPPGREEKERHLQVPAAQGWGGGDNLELGVILHSKQAFIL